MSLVDDIYGEVEVLRGMLMALRVNYPDLTPRMEPAVAKLDAVLNNPTSQSIGFAVEDMLELRGYFEDVLVMIHDKELDKSIRKTMTLMDHLLGPSDRVSLH